jgi:hypothetical protein
VLPLDATGRDSGDPPDLLGHEGARPVDLAQHLTARDGVDPERRRIDCRRGAVEPRERHGDEDEPRERASGVEISPSVGFRGAGDVQDEAGLKEYSSPPVYESRVPGLFGLELVMWYRVNASYTRSECSVLGFLVPNVGRTGGGTADGGRHFVTTTFEGRRLTQMTQILHSGMENSMRNEVPKVFVVVRREGG